MIVHRPRRGGIEAVRAGGIAMIVWAVACICSAASALGQTAPPAVLHLTLDSAVHRALALAPPVARAELTTRYAGAELLRSYTGLIPTMGLGTGLGVTTGSMLLGANATVASQTRFQTSTYQIATSLNVLNLFGSYPAIKSARAVQLGAGYSLTRARQTVTLDVTQSYLQAALDSELDVIARDNLNLAQQRVTQIHELVRVGKRPPADEFQAQAQASTYQAQLIAIENQRKVDETALLQRIRLDPRTAITLGESPSDTLLLPARYDTLDLLASEALRMRTDLNASHADVDAARWNVRRVNTETLPQLTIGAGLFSFGRYYDEKIQGGVNQLPLPQRPLADQYFPQTASVLTVGLGYDLGALFRSRVDREEAEVLYDNAQLAEDTVRLQVIGDVTRALAEYQNAAQGLAASGVGLSAAQAAYDLVSGRYDVGFATIVDLLTAQAALAQARVTRAQAIVQLELSKHALAYAMGLPPLQMLP